MFHKFNIEIEKQDLIKFYAMINKENSSIKLIHILDQTTITLKEFSKSIYDPEINNFFRDIMKKIIKKKEANVKAKISNEDSDDDI